MQIKSITSFYWKASKAAIAAIREVIKDNPKEFAEAANALRGLIDLVEAEAATTEPPPKSVEIAEEELTRSERRRRERAKARMSEAIPSYRKDEE